LQSNAEGSKHQKLEEFFAEGTNSKFAIAVNSGGTAIQMSLRGLGLGRNDEVVHQVDTCVATPFSVLNAQVTPIFHDINKQNFMLDIESLESSFSPNTKAIIATHMWGDPENLPMLRKVALKNNLFLIEDACLAFGTEVNDVQIGGGSTLGIFSFGSTKSVQAGGGGIIVTDDESLSKELKSMRSWGERTIEFGSRDTKYLSWNGKISEITAAIALQQVRKFNKNQNKISENVEYFKDYINQFERVQSVVLPYIHKVNRSYNQLRLNLKFESNIQKRNFLTKLRNSGVEVYDGNFEPLTSLSFFDKHEWKKWVNPDKFHNLELNYANNFKNANDYYENGGIGVHRNNFLSKQRLYLLKKAFTKTYSEIFEKNF
jgi:perosamine synthetase